ncbi:MAG TPA: HD domain-containing protein, partial [Planctomycetaceae bacterium]|nr:HD domain-containing protein [Planctomycetaceae bacterium]
MPALMLPPSNAEKLDELRARVADIRDRAQRQFQNGASGAQTATFLSDGFRAFVIEQWLDALQAVSPNVAKRIEQQGAVVAVGGTGRGELAPFSDIDLLFLYQPALQGDFQRVANQCLRNLWDADLKLGHSVRTPRDAIAMALKDSPFATSLVEMQSLWGSHDLVERLKRSFERFVVRPRPAAFVESCVANREEERLKNGGTVQQLEPDIKCSRGGLRDLHLLRWVGFALHRAPDIDALRMKGALSREDAHKLIHAHEFLSKIRLDLHFAAGKAQDRLTRDEQLRLARERNVVASPAQSPVEKFMQEYFQHTTAVANIVERFVSRHRRSPLKRRLIDAVLTRRQDGHFLISPTQLDVATERLNAVCSDLSEVLRLFQAAAQSQVPVAPRVLERIRQSAPQFSRELDAEQARLFLSILEPRGMLGVTLRAMFETGVLEVVLPEFARVRCLLQFNLYHHYTVDEHTLRALEVVESLEQEPGPVGAAYREIKLKPLLHLALLLHDVGKGSVEDHSDVGREIAEQVATRLGLPEAHRELLMFLIHKHLVMADVAFRHDISDPGELTRFSHLVGSPEWLTMLYVLTVADISAVGPDIWNDWKAGLLAELYDRSMMILSGKHPSFLEEELIREVREHVSAKIIPATATEDERRQLSDWLDQQLTEFPAHYLTGTAGDRIAADLELIRRLQPGEIVVEGTYEPETDTVEYRIILDSQHSEGCFHRIA